MPEWTHNPSSTGMTPHEMSVVNRLHHLADGPLDRESRSIVSDGLKLILELVADRGKRRDFDEMYDRPHDEG